MVDIIGVTLNVDQTRGRPLCLAVGWLEEAIAAHTLRGRGADAAEVTGHRVETDVHFRGTEAALPFEAGQSEPRDNTKTRLICLEQNFV